MKSRFTLEKIVKGVDTHEAFDFDWSCKAPGGAEKSGTVSVAGGDFGHVEELDKDMSCTVTEVGKTIDGKDPKISWTVNGEAIDSPAFVINSPDEQAVQLVGTNDYTPEQPTTEPSTPTTEPSAPTTEPSTPTTKPGKPNVPGQPSTSSTQPAAPGGGKPGAPTASGGSAGGKTLPVTGAAVVPLALASVMIIAVGIGLVAVRRKKRA